MSSLYTATGAAALETEKDCMEAVSVFLSSTVFSPYIRALKRPVNMLSSNVLRYDMLYWSEFSFTSWYAINSVTPRICNNIWFCSSSLSRIEEVLSFISSVFLLRSSRPLSIAFCSSSADMFPFPELIESISSSIFEPRFSFISLIE